MDLSNSINADDYTISIVDEFGNESNVSLNDRGCISYTDLNQGDLYTLKIQAINTSMLDNVDCVNSEQIINFTAPNPPSTKYNRNPCLRVEGYPQFPTSSNITERKVIKVVNIGIKRNFTFTNSVHTTGNQSSLATDVTLDTNEEIFIEIPMTTQGLGLNYFTVSYDGEASIFEYINH